MLPQLRVAVLLLGVVVAIRYVQQTMTARDAARDAAQGAMIADSAAARDSAFTTLAADAAQSDEAAERVAYALQTRTAGTYLPELLDTHNGWNYRWPDRRGNPLRIWVQEPRDNPAYEAQWATMVRESFSVWDGLGLPLRFSFTLDSARADVHVTWIDRFTERMTGRTRWQNDANGWIVAASIEIALHLPDGRRVTSEGVQAIARHEVGHLIGLDHTRDTTSIMAPQVFVTELSEADRRTARLIYDLPAGKIR